MTGEHRAAEPVRTRAASGRWARVKMLTVCGRWVRPTHVAVEPTEATCPDCTRD